MARPRIPKLRGKSAANATPRSSSLQTQGLAQAPQLNNEMGSGRPVGVIELVPELASSFSRLATYAKMMNDAGVDVSMRAAKTPILGADFFVEPASDSQEDADIAEFAEANLLGGMHAPFLGCLEDILHMFEDGYSVVEKIYENRQWAPSRSGANGKMYTMLKDLAPRPSSTIKDIEYDDNGRPLVYNHSAIMGDGKTKEVKLDADKLLVFTFARKGSDPTGKSLLRTAYPHWYYKTHFYKIDAIQKERHSLGVPKGKLQVGYTEKDKQILRTLLANIRSNEESFMVLTPNIDVEFAEVKGNLVDVLESANHHNIMILMNVMVQFLALGVEGSGGGRAVGGAQTDIYMKALRFVANYICEIVNMYLIPELVVYNFKTNRFPQLKARNMGETRDLQMLGSALGNLYSQGAITTDDVTEDWIRKVFDMPLKVAGTPAIDPNTHTGKTVTLYDSAGNAVNVPAGAVNGGSNGGGNNNGGNGGGKGTVLANGNGKGSGNTGKPATSAFGELAIHMPGGDIHHVPVSNEFEFAPNHTIENHIVIPEGAIPTPNVTIVTKEGEHKDVRPASSIVHPPDPETGVRRIDYVYEETEE